MLKSRAGWPRGIRWLAGGAVAVLAVAFLWALFVPVADWLARHDVGSATGPLHETALDNARGRLLTLGAGLLAAGALWFTARTFTLSREGQVTDRYTKAIEQLGSDKLDVRIGGIYALERIARDSARDHPTVMEVLTAFIREHSNEPWSPPVSGGGEPERLTRPDVQAALTVVRRRDQTRDIQAINLVDADLTYADLTDANLAGANLTHADLTGAILAGANLTGANLATVTLTGATLTGANLTTVTLIGATLAEATLIGADLTGARLATLTNRLGADFSLADLVGVRWPEGTPVPEGWELDAGTGLLRRAGNGSGAG